MAQIGSPEEARRIVNYWADEGVTWFKAYTDISREALGAAIKAAHTRGLQVHRASLLGVVPRGGALGIDNLEHGLFTNSDYVPNRTPDHCPPTCVMRLLKVAIDGPEVQQTIREMVDAQGRDDVDTGGLRAVVSRTARRSRTACSRRSRPKRATSTLTTRKETSARAAQSTMPELFRKAQAFERAFVKAGGLLGAGVDPTGHGRRAARLWRPAQLRAADRGRLHAGRGDSDHDAERREGAGVDNQSRLDRAGQACRSRRHSRQPDRDARRIRNVTIVFKDGVGYDSPKLLASVKGLVGVR